MEKIKNRIRKLSLRKSLWILLVIIITFITILTSITVFILAEKRQVIMENREIYITGYEIDLEKSDNKSYVLEPTDYAFSYLTSQDKLKYNVYSALIIILPCLYVISGVFFAVYLYYKLKLDKPIKELTM